MDTNQIDTTKEGDSIIKVSDVEFNYTDVGDTSAMVDRKIDDLRGLNNFTTFEVSAWVSDANAATATNYPIFYVANVQCFLLEIKCQHSANGGASAKVDVEKLVSGTAKGSGASMLKTKFDVTANANTVISTLATIVLAGAQLAPGDAIALKTSGTLTGLKDVCVTCLFGINMPDIPTSANVGTT